MIAVIQSGINIDLGISIVSREGLSCLSGHLLTNYIGKGVYYVYYRGAQIRFLQAYSNKHTNRKYYNQSSGYHQRDRYFHFQRKGYCALVLVNVDVENS